MDYRMLLTYITIDIFCIIIAAVINRNITSDSGGELEVKMIKRSVRSYIIFMIAGLTGLVLESTDLFYSKGIDYVANVISLSCLMISSFYWFIFVQLCANNNFMKTKWRRITYIPICIAVFACVASPLTGWVFYINKENTYIRGPLFLFVSAIPVVYDILASVTAFYRGFRENNSMKRKEYFNYGSFMFFPFIASLLQIWFAGMPVLAPSIASAYFIVFVTKQKSMIYNDSMTGLNNKQRAMMYIEEKMMKTSPDNPFTVFMIDGNKFKLVNDTYGHIEGDSAIVCISMAVAQISNENGLFCARYGGDEFIMIKSGECHFEKENIKNEINERLSKICVEQKKKYILTVSAGFYTSVNSKETPDTVIKMADQKLYEAKKQAYA